MTTRFRILLAAAMLASITCQIVLPGISPQVEQDQLDPASLAAAGSQLQGIIENETEMGELYELDTNQDGRVDEAIYHFPDQEIETDVILETNLIHSSAETADIPDPSAYYKALLLFVTNESGQEKHIQFQYDIPKDFAESVDELTFNPEPSRVINPDPKVEYDVVLAPPTGADGTAVSAVQIYIGADIALPMAGFVVAKARLRQDALNRMREACKSASPADKSICYLSLVTDFQDMLDKKEMESICTGEVTGLERRLCLSVAKDNAAECDRAALPEDVLICKGFYVKQKCKGLDGGELQACLKEKSIANGAPLGCLDLEDADIRNECVALASKDAEFCANINNQARRESCEKALNAGSSQANQPGDGSGSVDPSKWFNDGDSAEECKAFTNLFPEYRINRTSGGYFNDAATLSCSMDANDSELDDVLTEVNIWIYGYNSTEIARQIWDDETVPYSYASFKQQQETNTSPDITFTFESDSYFIVHKQTSLDNTVTYSMTAGSLYQNARIAFRLDSFAASEARWHQVEEAFKQLIDRKFR